MSTVLIPDGMVKFPFNVSVPVAVIVNVPVQPDNKPGVAEETFVEIVQSAFTSVCPRIKMPAKNASLVNDVMNRFLLLFIFRKTVTAWVKHDSGIRLMLKDSSLVFMYRCVFATVKKNSIKK